MGASIRIVERIVSSDHPVYVIAELSANHNQDYEQAVQLLYAAKDAGADAVKLQTYTADTITIRSNRPEFCVSGGTLWDGRTLHDLYQEAYTPWEWQPKLKKLADKINIHLFSSPFDSSAVDFLERMNVPAYKIASLEIVDLPLIRKIARTGKPIILSTGMATLSEVDEAVSAIRDAGGKEVALLKCTSGYPALPEEMNLRTIPNLAEAFGVPVGLSDHTLDYAVSVAAVALGACVIEKHFTLSRSVSGPDSAFSLEPQEFKSMVSAIRATEKALGKVHYGVSPREAASRAFRRSLYVVKEMKSGEVFTADNVRSIRPANGMPPKYLDEVMGRRANRIIASGTPLVWDLIG